MAGGLERTDQDLFKSHYAMMNLVQLQFMIDSSNKEIKQKQDHLYTNLVITNLFKKRNKPIQRTPPQKTKSREINRQKQLSKKKIEEIIQVSDPDKPDIKDLNKNVDSIQPDNTKDTILTKSPPTDSVKTETKTYDVDSLYNLLTIRDKSRILSSALTYARTSKNIVSNSAQSLDFKIRYLRRYQIEWHRKFTIAFACLVFLFIGAPLGAIIRKGGLGLPLVLSLIFFIFYYILSLIGDKLVRESILPAYQGMWLSSLIFFIIGIFLTYKATTDSSMLNMDTYLNLLKKYFGQRYNVVDTVNIQQVTDKTTVAKTHKIKVSLVTLQDSVNEMIEWKKSQFTFPEFIASLYSVNVSPQLMQFDKYYNNTFRILINNPVFHKKAIRDKVYDFPSFSNEEFADKKWKLVLKIAFASLPPLTLIVIIRQFIRLMLIDFKLKKIKLLIPELLSLININFPDSKNEDTSNLQ